MTDGASVTEQLPSIDQPSYRGNPIRVFVIYLGLSVRANLPKPLTSYYYRIRGFADNLVGFGSCSLFLIENQSQPTKNYLLWEKVAQRPLLT